MSSTTSVLVVLNEPLDLGSGAHERVVFPDATHHVDEAGVLHIRSQIVGAGNLAAFGPGEWRSLLAGVNVATVPVIVETVGQANATQVTTAGVA